MDKKRKFSKKALRDFDLIDAAIARNDQSAFAELMATYKNSIYFTILKMIRDPDDAEDLTIEAFSKAFNKLDKFKKDYTFSTWLFRIATNNTIDFIRKKRLKTNGYYYYSFPASCGDLPFERISAPPESGNDKKKQKKCTRGHKEKK